MSSPTVRTLDLLRKEGWLCAVVERYNMHAKLRQDLYGFGDVLAIHAGIKQTMIVQTTTRSNLTSRVKKAKHLRSMLICLRAGVWVQFHGWYKDRSGVWRVAIVKVTEADIDITQVIPRRPRKREEPGLFP